MRTTTLCLIGLFAVLYLGSLGLLAFDLVFMHAPVHAYIGVPMAAGAMVPLFILVGIMLLRLVRGK